MSPFERYRTRLESYRLARAGGMSDADFVALVRRLDAALEADHGRGFRITPLASAGALAAALGLPGDGLWLKDDTGNVAGSHKARHLFGVLLHLEVTHRHEGELAIASCGNAALAAAVVARAAGRALRVFIPTWADPAVVDALHGLDARVEICERREGEAGDPTYLRFTEAVADGATAFSCQGTMTPSTLDGGRTLGFEIADQLVDEGIRDSLRVYVQVGGGALASALWRGLAQGLAARGSAIDATLHPVQTEACAPLARAWQALCAAAPDPEARMAVARREPDRFMQVWTPVGRSAATGILDDLTYDWLGIAEAMNRGGWPVVVPEDAVQRAHALVHAHTRIDADATGSAGLAGVVHDLERGRLDAGATVLVPVTGITRR